MNPERARIETRKGKSAPGSVDGEITTASMSVKGKPASGSVEGESIPSMSVKDFEALIETAITKSMSSFRDEFEKLLEDRLNHYSSRLATMETLNKDQDHRIRELERNLNEMTERYFEVERKMDTVQKTADKFSDSSIVKLQGQITENLALTNDVEQYSRRLNIAYASMELRRLVMIILIQTSYSSIINQRKAPC